MTGGNLTGGERPGGGEKSGGKAPGGKRRGVGNRLDPNGTCRLRYDLGKRCLNFRPTPSVRNEGVRGQGGKSPVAAQDPGICAFQGDPGLASAQISKCRLGL